MITAGTRTAGHLKSYQREHILLKPGQVIPFTGIGAEPGIWLGKKVKMSSSRYELWKTKPHKCVCCGLKGQYIAVERNGFDGDRHHFNMYGVNQQGYEVQMTLDHIIPKSKGGPNIIENYQIMCERCNSEKGNKMSGNKTQVGGTDVIRARMNKYRRKMNHFKRVNKSGQRQVARHKMEALSEVLSLMNR